MGQVNGKVQRGFGPRIKAARKAAGYSQKGLAERLGWPSESNARVSGYESEAREPGLDDFEAIADACGVEVAWLVFAAPPKRRKVAA